MTERIARRKLARAGALILLVSAALCGLWLGAVEVELFPVLRSAALLGKQDGGAFLLPTNQLLRPWGEQVLLRGRPVDLAIDSSRRFLAVLNDSSVHIMEATSGAELGRAKSESTSYGGIAFRPGDREVWASEATRDGPDSILIAELSGRGAPEKTSRIALEGHPVPVGIAFSKDGTTAYVAFSRNNTVAVIDARSQKIVREVPAGISPFAIAFSAKSGLVFVANRGGRRPHDGDTLAPTSGAAVVSDPVSGFASTGTLSVIDAKTFSTREIAVGLAPSAVALSPDEETLAVANAHSDSVSLVQTKTLSVKTLAIPTWPEGTLGSLPVALAFAPDGQTLYVACGGNNAIAVAKSGSPNWTVAGAIPTGWFPSALRVDRDGALRIVNIKGVGNTAREKGGFNSLEFEGSLLKIPAPAPPQLAAGTREVKAANTPRFEPAGGVENLSSVGIQHVFFIIKENRTYDQVFGDLPKGNGDPKLVMYGRETTPNHHALAENFILLDNFYTSSAISFDGHQWLMQAFVSDYTERAFAASPRGYAWDMSDALTLSPSGFFWQGSPRPLSVRVFGEFCLPAKWDPVTQNASDINERDLLSWGAYWQLYKQKRWRDAVGCSSAGVPALKNIMSTSYPVNETSIPDQIRAEEFLRELAEREKTGEMPNVNIITLTADHTNGTDPGSPRPASMVADNDLALGRMVEGISKSRFWKKSLILVVEDDAQDGVDHVDGHRTVALAISPYVRRGAVDSTHYNQISMVRTIQEIFQIPPKTRFVKAARPMNSVFTAKADLAPYHCLPANLPLDDMNPPLKALSGRRLWAARQSAAMNWSKIDDVPSELLNRILWWDRKGYDTPYPGGNTKSRP